MDLTSPLGSPINEIDTPSLLVDLDKLERNVRRMADFSAKAGVALRPHVKSHKTPAIAQMQLEAGAIGLTCATLGEAEVMAAAGFTDLMIAGPVVGHQKIARLLDLAKRVDLIVALDDATNAATLGSALQATGASVRVVVEVDIGLHRCGVQPGRPALLLAERIARTRGLRFVGLMGYEGHCIAEKDAELRCEAATSAINQLVDTRRLLEEKGLPVTIVSGGGTGTYNITGLRPEMTELQPGSYVFMDVDYRQVTPEFEVSLTVLASVISRQGDRLVLDAGRKSIADDHGVPEVLDAPGVSVARITEEHAICQTDNRCRLKVGDKVQLLTGHCCTTVNLHDTLYGHRDGRLESVWPICARGRSR